jgi:methylated-DNA-[protein]-cysteine S-methyltransferase
LASLRRLTDMSECGHWTIYESPLGPLTIVAASGGALKGVRFPGGGPRLAEDDRRPLSVATAQLEEYFAGKRQGFELPLDLAGTPLQLQVWERLRTIPYGGTISYGELADDLEPSVFPSDLEPYERIRAAAAAVGRTPVPIVVPCHRVIGADGSLTGYGGGLERKQALLDLERHVAEGRSPEPAWAFRQTALL